MGRFGKQKLTKILYTYLEKSAPEKLAELKRELKTAGEYRKEIIRYKKNHSSEWLTTSIYFGQFEYRFKIYAFGANNKRITLEELLVEDGERGDIVTKLFGGYAYYTANFDPITDINERFSDLLICENISKKERSAVR